MWEAGHALCLFFACLLLFLVHFQGIAMMRTLRGEICQCIKYVERHLRETSNYTGTARGETWGGKKKTFSLHNFLFFLCCSFFAFELVMQFHSIFIGFVCFVNVICKPAGFYLWYGTNYNCVASSLVVFLQQVYTYNLKKLILSIFTHLVLLL